MTTETLKIAESKGTVVATKVTLVATTPNGQNQRCTGLQGRYEIGLCNVGLLIEGVSIAY